MSGAQPKRSECFGCSECFGSGTTHVIFEPLDFMVRLAALVPRPRANLARFHGVFAGAPDRPNSKHRALVTPATQITLKRRTDLL